MENLEKIDLIRQRIDVSYEKAYQALQETDGNVVEALIKLEKEGDGQKKFNLDTDLFHVKGQDLINKIKNIIKEGNVNKVIVKNDEKTLVEIPVTAGVVSLVLFPYLTLLAGATAMYKDYTLEIERNKEEEQNINQPENGE
ncbi:DUF4342 domain-containing protein [Iocasia frigidifontis]|uniref:DUF4342 domain-containing protein n=1 Tax=Iocasia fonsfrigidae TaxID=2682810 RepID=A0A8A7K9S2_9FIRM|nr:MULTISPECIES: DUF4342 domain-containing protein [Halanaerobiaceae]AZO95025.1 DUF4342 domain-containing protein [Halocella sp. SP3-1]MTI61299.1 DUF4342 domain-containing protein [Bacillota bacterium]QTL97980.1 DUF4342 domain-containing protein [Iocasia fonsfrigidae]